MKTMNKRTEAGLLCSALLFFTLALGSCQSVKDDPTSGETHFLSLCDPNDDSESCGEGLTCLCNVCTRPCTEDSACSELPAAACVDVGAMAACSIASASRVCAVECEEDSDCATLSSAHICAGGVCTSEAQQVSPDPVPDSSAPVMSSAPPDAGPPGSDAGVPSAPLCSASGVSANEVLIIGDSFFAASHEVTGFLEGLAREAGVLTVGERYRDNSNLITNALGLMGDGIVQQYTRAVEENPVRVVIMNGGGSDVLVVPCETPDAECPTIAAAAAAAEDLLVQMNDDGVTDVLYVSYPDPRDEAVKQMIDALRPVMMDVCESSAARCHWIDLRPIFEGHYDEYVGVGGLNPTPEGSEATAREIWGVMQENCIAQ